MKAPASYWIDHLQLSRHIEGGAFKEVYRSALIVPEGILPAGFKGIKNFCTSIYFLLEKNQFSALHRIASDEIWHFYTGDSLNVYEISSSGALIVHKLGNHPEKGEQFQCVVKAGSWFGSAVAEGGEYALVGCTVSPGFDFSDFELANRNEMIQTYPQHETLIKSLTH